MKLWWMVYVGFESLAIEPEEVSVEGDLKRGNQPLGACRNSGAWWQL